MYLQNVAKKQKLFKMNNNLSQGKIVYLHISRYLNIIITRNIWMYWRILSKVNIKYFCVVIVARQERGLHRSAVYYILKNKINYRQSDKSYNRTLFKLDPFSNSFHSSYKIIFFDIHSKEFAFHDDNMLNYFVSHITSLTTSAW